MMGMSSSIPIKVDPFAEYIEFMFTEKPSKPVAGCKSDDKHIMSYDELQAEHFYPSRIDVQQTDGHFSSLGEEAVMALLIEFWDPSKATSAYLTSISGKFIKSQLSDQDRMAGINKDASNSISESNHASSTHSLKTNGTIPIETLDDTMKQWLLQGLVEWKVGTCIWFVSLCTSRIVRNEYSCCQTWCIKDQNILHTM